MHSSTSKKFVFSMFCLANTTISFNFAALAAAVPVMSRDLGVSQAVVSSTSACYMIPYGLGALMYAPLIRKFSQQMILCLAMGLYVALNVVCSVANSIEMILLARVAMGLAAASVIPLCLIAVGTLFPRERRGRLVGLFFSTSFVASVLGIAVSGFCHWRWLFIIPALLGGVTVALMLGLGRHFVVPQSAARIDYRKILLNVQFRNILIFIFAISFLYHGVHKWLGVYLDQEYHLSQAAISFYFMLIALAGAVGQNVGGYLTDKQGRLTACLGGVVIMAMATMLLYERFSPWILGVILSVFSIGWTIGHNGVSTVLTDFPDESRAEIAGLNSAIRFFSGGIGFFVGGPFVERNFSVTFLGFGILMLTAALFLKNIIPQEKIIKGETTCLI